MVMTSVIKKSLAFSMIGTVLAVPGARPRLSMFALWHRLHASIAVTKLRSGAAIRWLADSA
jgi:hypothetical protein